MLAAAVASCTKETTPERINIQHPDQQSPILRDNAYYQNLRAYKQTKHKLAFGWYGSWTAVGASYQSRLISAPDSMDIISIWSQWHTLTPQQMADKEFVQKTLGTKVTYTIFSDKLPEPFLEIGNGEYTDEAIEAYAKAYCKDSMDKYQYDGIDIDYEPGYGASGPFVGHDNALFTKLINAMSKYVGPKSGTGRLLIIDGVPYAVDRSVVDCFDYGIVQAYASSGYTDLQNRFNNADAKGWKPEQYIFAENFESYGKTGGVNFTDREGNRMPSLYGMATFNPTQGAGAGFGAYHMEYEYGNSAMPYQFMRNAIQMANPAGGWKTPIDVAFSSNQSSNFSFVVEDDGSVTGTMQDKVSLSFSRPVVSGMQLTLGVDNSLVAVYNDENGTEYETVDPSLVKMEPIQCAENQVFSPDATITLDPKSIEKGYYLIPVVISPISDAGYVVKEGSVHYIFVTKVAMDVEIGATTLDEFQKYFEQDKALERRFQKVMVDEPTQEDAISILRGLKERYENHHQVRIKDEAIVAAVELSTRYITSRFLPDKAIDLVDEAASRLRLEMNSVPDEIDSLERRMRQLEIEREAIRREKDKERIDQLTKEIEELKAKDAEMRAKWQGQRDLLKKIQTNKDRIEQLKVEAQQAERQGDYGKVAEIRYGKIQEAEKQIAAFQEEYKLAAANGSMIKEEVDAQDVAEVVSRWTGIPVTRMLASEREKLLHMEEELHKRVVGQEQAIAAISDAVRRSRAGLNDPRKPIGSFIFLGTTGVGKTELAKALAEFLFNDDQMMTRIDMSEYQERHSVSRLVGAPPGYVGYDEGGQLTEAVRRKPYSVVLLDEIEKAHPDVFNILLQVLDDGRLTDNKGRTVDFRNTIIIMTSNMGSQVIQENFAEAFDGKKLPAEVIERTRREVIDLLKQQLKPEFLNRIDEIVMFEPLTRKDIERIVDIQMSGVRRMLGENGIRLEYSDKAREWIANAGFDPLYGARPVKRTIQRYVINDLSKRILAGEVDRSKPISIDAGADGLVFTN